MGRQGGEGEDEAIESRIRIRDDTSVVGRYQPASHATCTRYQSLMSLIHVCRCMCVLDYVLGYIRTCTVVSDGGGSCQRSGEGEGEGGGGGGGGGEGRVRGGTGRRRPIFHAHHHDGSVVRLLVNQN